LNRADTIAERFNSLQGLAVADCLELASPVYSVQADVVCIERRELLPTEEYVLRAVETGISSPAEIFGLLGFLPIYGHQLID
jgi:hypothetical protein